MIITKDKKTVDLIAGHLDTVVQCIKTGGRAVDSYIEGNISEASDMALQADALELDANHKMEEITRRLCYGGGLAPIRDNLYQLASSLNRTADEAATCCLFFLDRRPEIPQPSRSKFGTLAAIAFSGHSEIKKGALYCLKGGWNPGKYFELTRKFRGIRKELKIIFRDLNRLIFEADEALKQHMSLDASLTQVTGVFDRIALTAETITRINLRIGI